MAVLAPAPWAPQPRTAAQRTTETAPLVSVVIVNYRRWEETAALVEQMIGEEHIFRDRFEVVVVDNDSPPDAIEERIRRYGVQVHRLPENRGFSAGVNEGFRRSRGKWILVLNPDLIVCRGFVDLIGGAALELEDDLCNGQPVGIVGFQLRNRDGTRQFSTGLLPNLTRMVLGLLRPRAHRKYEFLETRERQAVPWVTGSCLLVRRECLAQLGGFDEDYFLYYEDVDLCFRAAARGWGVCYEPAVRAVHLDPLQNRPLTETMRAVTRHASLTYFQKHLRGAQFWGLAQLVRAEAWIRQQLALLRGRSGDAETCRDVRGLCRDLMRWRPDAARRRLDRILMRAGMRSGHR